MDSEPEEAGFAAEEFGCTEAELCGLLDEEFGCTELLLCAAELDSGFAAEELLNGLELLDAAVVSGVFATPSTANFGAKPAFKASMAPARYARGAFQLMATSFVA